MNRCVTYTRVSTDDQAERGYSLPSQAHELREYARRKGYAIADELTDDGYSGAMLDRPALTALRDGVRAGRWDVVLVHAPDRLSRNLVHQLLLLDEFRKAGARAEFVTTPAEDTAEGRLLLNVSGVVAEFEREKIKERTSRGKREKARRGNYVQPRSCPFGYRADPVRAGQLMIHEDEAEIVRLIYRLLIDEKRSVRGIVMELRRRGVRSARGQWTCPQVSRVLTGGYSGTRYFNKKQMQPDGGARIRSEQEWIPISVPAIVTPEREQQARAQLDRNRAALVGRPPTAYYLLRGLLVCDACGRRYRGSTTGRWRRYCHQNGGTSATCAAPRHVLAAPAIERAVRDAVRAALSDPAVLRGGVAAYEASRGATDVELRSSVAHLAKQIAKIRKDEARLIGLVVDDGEQRDMVEAKLRELAQRRRGLTTQLAAAQEKAARHGAGPDFAAIEAICAKARRGLARLTDAGWQALLRDVVDEVRVRADRSLEIRGLIADKSATYDVPEADSKLSQPSKRA